PPGGANRVVAQFLCLIRCIPTLNSLVARLNRWERVVYLEPTPMDDLALERNRALLVLRREVKAPEDELGAVQHLLGFARRMKKLSCPTWVSLVRPDRNLLVALRNRGQIKVHPVFLRRYVAGQVLEMKALHDHNDHALPFVVQPRVTRAVEHLVHRRTF